MEKLAELRRKLGVLTDELNSDAVIADEKAFLAKEGEIRAVQGEIDRAERAPNADAPSDYGRAGGTAQPAQNDDEIPF